MRALSVITIMAALVLPTAAFAEIQTFTTTHTYVLGDDDSRNSARQKCLAEAKRKILEQVGVYLESKSELITSSQSTTSGSAKSPQTTNEERQQITEQINTLAAGVMRTEVIKEEFGEINGRLQMTLTLKAAVDPDDIHRQLAARRVDQGVRKQVTEQGQRLAQLEEELSSMKKEMRSTAGNALPGLPKKDDGTPDTVAVRDRANRGDAEAQNNLGTMYYWGHGVPQDYAKARGWFEQAAAQGNALAQNSLGAMYDNGQGVPQDYAKARGWFEQAAAQGNALAQNNLGFLYDNGRGVPKDYAKARQWYEQAAAQGLVLAQTNLGMLYQNGQGVPQDYVQARQWYEKAAAQGNAVAQTNLGVLYEQGGQLTVFLKPLADQNAAPQPSERAVKVKLATVTDDRQEKGRIGTREAAFGISMGDVHLGQKAAETMQQALSDDLLAAGYRVVETGQDLIAEGRLRKFWVRTDTTVLYWDVVGDIEFELAVLPATQKKEPVEKTFTCHQVERTYLWPSATLLGKVLDACLADMMLKVRTDDIWKQAVNY
jgi:TPR repeat protein